MLDHVGYCSPDSVDMEYIDEHACRAMMDFKSPDTVFMSIDVYQSFLHKMIATTRYYSRCSTVGLQIFNVNTCVGELKIQCLPGMTNFCLIGTQKDLFHVEWIKINKQFEEIILRHGEADGD